MSEQCSQNVLFTKQLQSSEQIPYQNMLSTGERLVSSPHGSLKKGKENNFFLKHVYQKVLKFELPDTKPKEICELIRHT